MAFWEVLAIEFSQQLAAFMSKLINPDLPACFYFTLFHISSTEGKASQVRYVFGQSNDFSKKDFKFAEIYKLKHFDPTKTISVSDLASIILTETVPTTATVAPAVISLEGESDAFVGENLLVCGFGFINNHKEKPGKLKCTNIRVVPVADCIEKIEHFWLTYK